MKTRTLAAAATAAVLAAAALVSCSAEPDSDPAAGASVTQAPFEDAGLPETAEPEESAGPATGLATGAESVRDAFAGVQATLDDSGKDDWPYFLSRVDEELAGLERAMMADPKATENFGLPMTWLAELARILDGDHGFASLDKHHELLIGTRDKVNIWMQDHPELYR